MRKMRFMPFVLAALVITLFPMAATSLPITGCRGCSIWYDADIPYAECDNFGQDMAGCDPIYSCDIDNLGHRVNCVPTCAGQICYWV